jgi:hypothetical protein
MRSWVWDVPPEYASIYKYLKLFARAALQIVDGTRLLTLKGAGTHSRFAMQRSLRTT